MSSCFWRAACGRGAVLAAALWLGAAGALAQSAPPEPPVIYQIQPGQSLVDGSHLWLLPPANTGGAPITKIHTFFTNPEDGVGYSANGDVPSPPYPIFPININGWFVDYATQAVFSVWAENSVGFSPTLVVSISTGLRAPTAPRNLRAETLDGEISLFWNIPLNSGGPPNSYYTSQYRVFYGGSTTLTIAAGEYIQPGLQYNIGKFAEQTVISVDTSAARGISIWARNAVGWGPVAVATAAAYSAPAAATTAPGAPVSLTVYFNAFDAYAQPQTPGQVRFFPPTVRANLATGFYILYNGQSVDISHTAGQTGQKTRNITGLTRGNTVVFSVVAKGASGNGPAAVYSVRIPATGPGKATNIRVLQANDQRVVLTWDAPTFWGGWGPGPNPYGRQLYRVNINDNNHLSGLSSGNISTNTVTIARGNTPSGHEFEVGRRYKFVVLARSNSPNAGLQNRLSDDFFFTIPGNPSPPQNLTGQPRSGQVVLSWDAPDSWGEGGGGATDNARIVYGVATSTVSYTLSHNTNPSELRPLATLNPITINKLWTSSNVGENLINGVAYKFEVAVVNALGGVGTLSAPITVTPAVPVTPAAVQNVDIVVGDRSAVATWSAPSNAGSFSLKEYVVSIIRSNVANVYTVTSPAITITAHNNAPLVGDSHWFRVFARSQVNVDGPMHGELFTPNATFPDEPNVVVSALAGGSQISVSWSAALQHLAYNTAATAYAVHLGAFSVEIASATTATIIGNLQSNTAYTLSVWGISPGGAGFARVLTATTAAPSAPATPQNFRIISQDIRYGIVLAWDSPTNWGGSTLSVYQLGMDINFSSEWGTHETTATRHTITQHDGFHVSFLDGSSSRFRVRARSQAGLDSSYVQINGGVLASSPDAPNVAATALASGTQISVSWSKASNSSRNNAATAYAVRLGNVDSTLAASITSTVFGGLQVNTAYTLSVQGVAPLGAGAARVLTITTAAGPPAAPSVVVSPTPDGRTPAQVTLSWSVPNDGGNPVTAYIFSYGTITATLQTSQTATVVSVSLGVSYAFTLRAVNSDGASPAGVITASIAPPSPTPTGFRSEPCGRNCLILEWQRPTDDSLLVEYLLSGIDGGGRAVLNRYIPASGTGPVSVGKIGNFINTALPAIAPVVRLTLIGMGGGNVSYLLRVVRAGRILYGSDLGLSAAPTPQADTPTLRAVVSDASSSVYVSGATLFWSHPNDNGNAIEAYYLSYNDNVVSLASTATAYTPAGLVDGTQYAFTLQATNAIWMSEPGVLSVLPYSRPGDVSNIQYADIGNGRVSLSWNPPANTGGLSLLYFIEDTYATATHTANANSYTLGVAGEGTVTLTVNIAAAGNPSVSVFAKGGSVAAVVAVSAAPPLSAPQNFRVVSRDSRYGFVVAWDEPASWGGSTLSVYRVGLDVNSNGWATRETTDTRITISHYQGSHTNLWAGGSSRFRILARSQAGEDSARITINGGIISQSPNAPNVMATALAGGTQISVSWSKFSNNAIDNAATAYAVRLGGIDSTLAASITSTVVGNLSPGTPYTLSVHGISPIGKGPARVVVATTDFANPGKPLNVRAVEIGDGYVVIAWDEPSWGGSSMSLYRAYYRESGDSWNRIGGADITAYAAAYTLTQSGLTNGNAYHFHVLAQSQAGLWSDPPNSLNQAGFTPTLTASPVAVPSRPTIVATPNANGAQISLSWSANDNGETITAYLYSFNGGAVITLTGGITSTVETGLAKFSPYTLSLAAVNANGAGPSSVVVVTTQATNPGAPRNLVATPGDGFLIFTWDEPADWGGSTLSVYQLFFGPVGQAFTPYGTPTVASLSVGSLTNGNQYRFRVRARSQANKNGPYAPIVTASPAAVPSRPVVTAGINANGEEITLSWSASGGGITAFLYSFNGGAFVTLTGNTITSTVEAGLAKNSPHTLSLAAVNAGGTSPYTVAVFNTPATNPTPPRNVRTVEVGNGYVVFAWDEPADWGGSSLSVYQYAYREVGGTHAPFNQANNTATVSGLTNGTPYEFFVYAQSQANKWSDSSPTLTATPVALPSVSFATVIALASGTEISVSLLVDDGGNALTGLTLLYGGAAAVALSPTTRATVLSSLNITTAYTLSVIAVNSVGAATAVATATTPAPPPSAVQNLSLVSSDARVGFVFSWDAPTSWGGSALSVYRLSLNIASNDWQGYETTDTRITITSYGGSALHLWQPSPFFWARVIARSQAGVDSSHVQLNGGAVASSPNAPIVAATALASGTEISVNWRKANNSANNNNATAYAVHLGTVAATLGGAITATVVGNLQGNTGYTLSVWAINPVGAGGIRALTLTTAVIPAPPGVSFAAVTALSSGTEISLSLLVDESGGALSGLTLLYGGTAAVALSPTTRATVLSSLSPTTAYTLSVIAVNAAGAATAVATATTPDLPTAPGAPSIAVFPTPDGVTPQRLTIVLSVSNNGGSPITNYRIRYGSSNYPVGVSGSPATHIITDTDIFVLDADFVFSFAAINAVGEGPAATATARANSTAPFAPTAFAAAPTPQGAMPAQVTLSWSAPPNGGKNITAYILSYGTVSATLPASQTLSVVGVSFDVAHSFTLRAANENGASPAAVVSASIAPLSAPDAPALNAAATPAGVTPAQVTLSWSAPANGGSPITAYFLSYGTVSATLPASANATVVSVLLDVAYLFTLQAANTVGASPAAVVAASIAPPVALPSMPQNLRVNVVGDVVVFEWNAPASNGGAAISEYLVYVNGEQTSAVTGLAANLSGLVDGNYNLGVAAVNSAGTGQRAQITQSLSFAVLTEEKKKEIDKTILPAVAGVLSQQLANIVGDRIAAPALDVNVGGNLNLLGAKLGAGNAKRGIAQMLKQHGGALANGGEVSESALRNGSFALPLAATGDSAAGVKMGVWGGAAYGNMENEKSAIQYDGKNAAYYTGMDATFGDEESKTKVGAMFVHSRADANYTDAATGGAGEYNMHANSGKGYLGWSGKNYSAHGSFGFGKGEVKIQAAGGDSETRKVNLYSASAGGRAALLRGENGALWGEADWSIADIRFAGGNGEGSRAQNLRAALEASQQIRFVSGGGVEPFMRAGYLRRFGETSANGWETGAGLRWSAAARWRGEFRARYAQYNSGDKQLGVAAVLRAEAANNRGLALSLTPQYNDSAATMGAELTYGIATSAALWRPRLAAKIGEATEYQAGAQWQSLLQNRVALRAALTATRKQQTTALNLTFGARY